MRPCLKLLDGAIATNGPPSNTAATGSITAAAGNTIVDGSSFTLNDGINPGVQFVFSTVAITESATKKRISYTTGDTAGTVKTAIRTAIDAVTTGLRITTTDPGGDGITLTNDFGGAHGNVAIANFTTLTMSGMTGGITVGFPLNGDVPGTPYRWHLHDAGALQMRSTAGTGTMTITLRLWVYSELLKAWMPLGINATMSLRGVLDDGTAITEDGSDILTHTEPVQFLSAFDYIYAEIVAIGGTGTAVDLYLNSCAMQSAGV